MLDLGIIIVNWNTRDLLRDCLKSLAAAQGDFSFKTVVVDNASSDGSAEMVQREFPDVLVIASPTNDGFSIANNKGLRALGLDQGCGDDTPRYALILNPDTVVPPTALCRDDRVYGCESEGGRVWPQADHAGWESGSGVPPQFPYAGNQFLPNGGIVETVPHELPFWAL